MPLLDLPLTTTSSSDSWQRLLEISTRFREQVPPQSHCQPAFPSREPILPKLFLMRSGTVPAIGRIIGPSLCFSHTAVHRQPTTRALLQPVAATACRRSLEFKATPTHQCPPTTAPAIPINRKVARLQVFRVQLVSGKNPWQCTE